MRQQRADEGQHRHRAEAEEAEAERQQKAQRAAQRRAARDAQRVRVGQRIAQQALEQHAGAGQRGADDRRAGHARQTDGEEDGLVLGSPGRLEARADQVVQRHPHQVVGPQLHRPKRRREQQRPPAHAASITSDRRPHSRPHARTGGVVTRARCIGTAAAGSGRGAAVLASCSRPSISRGPGRRVQRPGHGVDRAVLDGGDAVPSLAGRRPSPASAD